MVTLYSKTEANTKIVLLVYQKIGMLFRILYCIFNNKHYIIGCSIF